MKYSTLANVKVETNDMMMAHISANVYGWLFQTIIIYDRRCEKMDSSFRNV